MSRRDAIKLAAKASAVTVTVTGTGASLASLAASPGCAPAQVRERTSKEPSMSEQASVASSAQSPILQTLPLSFPWQTRDPFLFCVHHDDAYPKGNAVMGPAVSLAGREIGMDFTVKDGFRMYHGQQVPGFPQHPHRGFETVTVVRRGLLDHSDSMGATARYGGGDVQWLTAGAGILHSEMFPLVRQDRDNPVELFQIWLNLPAKKKMAQPYFSMLWNETVPRSSVRDAQGRVTELTIVAGRYEQASPPSPPPDSYASQADSDVAIWTLKLEPGASFTLPPAAAHTDRSLYFFLGGALKIGGRAVPLQHRIDVRAQQPVLIENGAEVSELLMLQGRPIAEPVVKHGPFVMNTQQEIQQAFVDYRRTQFGGWPWASDEPVHAREEGRFARRPDGTVERPA